MKLFKSKKTRLIALISVNLAVLGTALVLSTVSWFASAVTMELEEKIPSSILSSYFDRNELPSDFDETLPNHQHGSALNPYVITRPVHYYNLVRLHELGTYGFDENTYFQFGKQFGKPADVDDPNCETYPFQFYSYSDGGVLESGYTTHLNMKYYSGSMALAPIGSARHPFEGHINGNNLTVSQLHINGGGYSDIGIFGYVDQHAVINNLYFDSPYIDAANASAVAPSSLGHATHESHVYIGFLAGHVYNPGVFTHVYLNNCHLYNTVGNEYEMINTYGFFGHTDQPLESTSDSSSYTSELKADKAYEALGTTYANGQNMPLARRYTDQVVSGTFKTAVSTGIEGNNTYYDIGQKDSSNPYSLSSIGYSSGDRGTEAYIRYIKTEGGVPTLKKIDNVADENILTDKPIDPTYGEFGGMYDGAYIYYDANNQIWKYAEVTCDTEVPTTTATVRLNCFTISYKQGDGDDATTYYLKYKAKEGNETYDTLINEEWTSNSIPTADEYYFCFKPTFGDAGVSQITESAGAHDYYIYSPVGKNYLTTFAPQNTTSSQNCEASNLLHTPVFVDSEGTNGHYPLKFTVGGPTTFLTYDAVDNKNTGPDRDVNYDFDHNTSNSIVKGALQGPNLRTAGLFGGHKMTSPCPGGEFTIGEYIENQTTTLTNATNFRLTGSSSEITDGSTILIAGFDGEQTGSASTDYAMALQTQNNRQVQKVYEVRDGNNYVINDTTGVAKMTFHYVSGNSGPFTLFDDGYLRFPSKNDGTPLDANRVITTAANYDIANDTAGYCKWTFEAVQCTSQITKYRFKNVGATDAENDDNSRYLCYNNSDKLFSCYKKSALKTHAYEEQRNGWWQPSTYVYHELTGEEANTNPNDYSIASQYKNNEDVPGAVADAIIPNSSKWFYIYKQQTGQTLSNVHYVRSVVKEVESATIYPYKNVVEYDLQYAPIDAVETNINAYSDFKMDPSFNVYFDVVQSQVHYYDTLVETWKRVSIVSELKEGAQVVIAAKTSGTSHYFMSTTQNNNYRGRTSNVSFTPPYLGGGKLPNAAQKFTLQRTANNRWRFYTGTGYLYAASSSNNYLRTERTPDANGNADFAISIDLNANATIRASGNYSHNLIQYYSRSGYFSCFTGSQTAVQIYQLTTSTADQSTYVGDLIDDFEPFRMDVTGPSFRYFSTYMQNTGTSEVITDLTIGATFYPTKYFKNSISILIDNNGSKDLGTLIFECSSTSTEPYFMPSSSPYDNLNIMEAGAVDTDRNANDNIHKYLININAINIPNLSICCLKGAGTTQSPYIVCTPNDTEMTKYVILIGCASDIHINEVVYTFNAVPGNIGYSGTVDYRTATYDEHNFFTGEDQQVTFSAISVYYDVTSLDQKISVYVTYAYDSTLGEYVYTVHIDSSGTQITSNLIINIFKYDNNASALVVVADGGLSILVDGEEYTGDPIYNGTTSVTISPGA